MAAYNPPGQPGRSGNVLGDVERAFAWTAEFFSVRAPLMRMVSDVNIATVRRLF